MDDNTEHKNEMTIVEVPNHTDQGTEPKPQVIYRCKKCRRIVASQENIVTHDRGEGQKCFKWKKRSGKEMDKEPPECSSIFVEPMKWMQAGSPKALFSCFALLS